MHYVPLPRTLDRMRYAEGGIGRTAPYGHNASKRLKDPAYLKLLDKAADAFYRAERTGAWEHYDKALIAIAEARREIDLTGSDEEAQEEEPSEA